MKILLTSLIVVCSFALGLIGFAVLHPAVPPAPAPLPSDTAPSPSPAASPPATSAPQLPDLSRRITFLIIGVDFAIKEPPFAGPVVQSDTLILVSADPHARRVTAISIPRDTLAEIPNIGARRIAHAYAYGAVDLTVQTVERLLDRPIQYYMQLDLIGFARLIDAIGGIQIEVESDIRTADAWTGAPILIPKGRGRMTGTQALYYVRFRRDRVGDIDRVRRQQQMLRALAGQLRAPTLIRNAPSLVQLFLKNVNTNMSSRDLLSLGGFMIRLNPESIQMATLPGRFTSRLWRPDPDGVEQLLRRIF